MLEPGAERAFAPGGVYATPQKLRYGFEVGSPSGKWLVDGKKACPQLMKYWIQSQELFALIVF